MNIEFMDALEELEKQKGISKDVMIEAIDAALTAAYKRTYSDAQNVRVSINRDTGDIHVYALLEIVEEVEDTTTQIAYEQSKAIKPILQIGDIFEREIKTADFGRIAAQTAKQVVVQRIREAERNMVFDEFADKKDEVVTGIINRVERGIVYVTVGHTEASLPPQEQMRNEKFYPNDRLKVYLTEVRHTGKGPQVMVSRSHPGLVKRLFEMEVPEIQDGVVEIKSISREAGSRTKMAVYSRDPNVDPVGACVGQRGMRVEKVVDELKGEKIDIVPWNADPVEYIAAALSPAKVSMVQINEPDKMARIIVPDNQLSLAIGRDGQNARLAARLTSWKIDIKSQSQILAAASAQPKADDEVELLENEEE
ncbi:MAG: transcription termination factor NusA [Eubacteriales bacterium]|nr:transcription termination factor NusA [Eubacteriales bacterium]